MSKTIGISINLIVESPEAIAREIADYCECDVEDINEDTIQVFISDHIRAKNICNDLFVIEGAETDGRLVHSCDCDEFLSEIQTND